MVFYVYKIKDVNYIGSTNDIKNRTREHNFNSYNENSKNYNYLIYKYIREKQIEIKLEILGVYKKKCSKRIKLLVEQFYINKYNSINNGLNSRNAFTNIKKYKKIYREKNKEHNKKYQKEYYKKYYQENKEKEHKRHKKYRENNKKKINKKRKEKIICPICDSLITKHNFKKHLNTKKCISAM